MVDAGLILKTNNLTFWNAQRLSPGAIWHNQCTVINRGQTPVNNSIQFHRPGENLKEDKQQLHQ